MFAALLFVPLTQQAGLMEAPFTVAQNAIIVKASVNAHPLSLVFDTGFGAAVILDDRIDIGPPTGKANLRDFVGMLQVDTVKLKNIKIGGLNVDVTDYDAMMQPGIGAFGSGTHIDGIMGLAVIEHTVTEINFQKNKFIFHPSTDDISQRTPDNKKTFLAKLLPIGGDSLELEVQTQSGQKMHMALDTGNAFYATTHRDVLERVGLWEPGKNPKFVKSSMVASGAVDSWSKKMTNLTIFGVPVDLSFWDVIDRPSSSAEGDGTVGFGFLKNFNITIDYERRRVWLERFTDQVGNTPEGDTGLIAAYDPRVQHVRVFAVAPDSPAEKAGIKVGDSVLAIGDNELEGRVSFKLIQAMLAGDVGSKVTVSTSRAGDLKRYELERIGLVND